MKQLTSRITLVASLALAPLAVGCGSDDSGDSTGQQSGAKDILDVAGEAGSFTTLAAAVEAADLVSTLKSEGPFTVFAPVDDAFAALPEGTLDTLLMPENKQMLTDILTYHVVSGEVLAADVVGLEAATTVNGSEISIAVVDGEVVLNGSVRVVQTDVTASNGVIHVIDGVLLPPEG